MKAIFNRLTPKTDKLKHLYWFTLAFIGLTTFLEQWKAFVIVILLATLIEVVYDGLMKKGTPEIMDVFWSVFFAGILTLKYYLMYLINTVRNIFGIGISGFEII